MIQFNGLIEELASNMVNAPASEITEAIQDGLERIAETLGQQYCALNLMSSDRKEVKHNCNYSAQ
jgi:ferredoxin-thioredoxin reductase catalytic subunit